MSLYVKAVLVQVNENIHLTHWKLRAYETATFLTET
jgi:hypothetical protein